MKYSLEIKEALDENVVPFEVTFDGPDRLDIKVRGELNTFYDNEDGTISHGIWMESNNMAPFYDHHQHPGEHRQG